MPQPAYMKIADVLKEQIQAGELLPHDSIPPERELCTQFGVSRMTGRRALTLLEEDGLVYRDGNRGTFVADSRISLRVGSFSQEVEKLGHLPSAEVIWSRYEPASIEASRNLQIEQGTSVAAIRRLRMINGAPIGVETTYYPEALVPDFFTGDLGGSLWKAISDRYGITVALTAARMEVVILPVDIGAILSMRHGSHGIQLTRTSEAPDGSRIEYAVDVYRADRVSLLIDREFE